MRFSETGNLKKERSETKKKQNYQDGWWATCLKVRVGSPKTFLQRLPAIRLVEAGLSAARSVFLNATKTTAACAAGVVTKTTDRDSLRYTYWDPKGAPASVGLRKQLS